MSTTNWMKTSRRFSAASQPGLIVAALRSGPKSMGELYASIAGSPGSLCTLVKWLRRKGLVRRLDLAVPFTRDDCRVELGKEPGMEFRARYRFTQPPVVRPRPALSGQVAGRIEVHGVRWGGEGKW